VNHADAQALGVVRRVNGHVLALPENLAGVCPVNPVEHLHQRAFASAILAHQRQNLAGMHGQIHALKRLNAGERLADAPHL